MAYITKTTNYLKKNAAPLFIGAAIAFVLLFVYKKIVGCPCSKSKKTSDASFKMPGAEIDVSLPKNNTDV